MSEPSRRTSRLALVGGLIAASLCAGLGFTVGRSTVPTVTIPAVQPVQAPAPTPAPTSIPAPSVLSRADLLTATSAAIDGISGGQPAPKMLAYVGRRFELRLPFGCDGPTEDPGEPLRWRYDEKNGTLRVSATPVRWPKQDWLADDRSTTVENVEGFWIKRPWTSSEACPRAPTRSQDKGDSVETLGLAMFASTSSSRVGRRPGEGFDVVKKIERVELDASNGFRLRLTGRVASAPGAGPIMCRALAGPERRPTCLIAVTLDEVAVEYGTGGETLATWAVSSRVDEGHAAGS